MPPGVYEPVWRPRGMLPGILQVPPRVVWPRLLTQKGGQGHGEGRSSHHQALAQGEVLGRQTPSYC